MNHKDNGVTAPELPIDLEPRLYELYRTFFDQAEKSRRWRIRDDIPWNECNPNLNPAIADVVETFCAVELYLPDYTGKILPVIRHSRGRMWFYANWGYEESKHSLALGDWLLKSKHRTDEQMADMEKMVFEREWNLPTDCPLGMLAYAMVQEHATFINYRNLRNRIQDMGGDPALEKLLRFVSIDEAAHHAFFKKCMEMFVEIDRDGSIEALKRVLNQFQMPAIHDLLDENAKRIARVRELGIFNEEIFFTEVYGPVIRGLGIERSEMRNRSKERKSTRDTGTII